MIEVTDEMLAAFAEQQREPIPVRERPERLRAGLAAVLAIVERDWNMQPNPNVRSASHSEMDRG